MLEMSTKPLLVILGATASGKTKLAVSVARNLSGEIISADSRQVYKNMDIGTGKDLQEFFHGGKSVPYHLIDILEPGLQYNVDAFKNDFYLSFVQITERGNLPILCGGTGMYIHSLFQNQLYTAVPENLQLRLKLQNSSRDELIMSLNSYPPKDTQHADLSSNKRLIRAIEVAEYLKFNTLKIIDRPKFKPIVIGLKNEVENTRKNILIRLEQRLSNGLVEEVQNLLESGVTNEMLIFYGLEYKFVSNYLSGRMDYDELKEKLGIAICQFAKRQNTFFRKMEKDGVKIHWIDASMQLDDQIKAVSERVGNENHYTTY